MNLPAVVIAACQEIAADRTRGAHDLARRAVVAIGEALRTPGQSEFEAPELVEIVKASASALARIRPAVSAIANAVAELHRRVEQASLVSDCPLPTGRKVTEAYLAELDRAVDRTVAHVTKVIASSDVVLTLSQSRTVLEALIASKPTRTIVAESRPLYEGRRTAEAIHEAGLEVELVTDAAAPGMVRESSVVLVGATAVLADGALVNKVGTYAVGLAARAASIRLYAATESLKFSPGRTVLTELHRASEVWQKAPPGVTIRNPHVEEVPSELITGFFTEHGLVEPRQVARIVRSKRRALQAIGVKEP